MNLFLEFKNRLDHSGLWEQHIVLKRNEFLKVKGSVDTNLYGVVSGSLRIFLEDDFEEKTIRLGYSNNLIAALDSFISGKPSELYIQAIKRTELQRISKKRFLEFVDSNVECRLLWYKLLEQMVLEQMEREQDILTRSPKERYLRVLSRSPQLFQEIPAKHIASYLRMSPETLSRLRKS